MNKTIQEKINKLKEELSKLEKDDSKHLSVELAELRNFVMFAHSRAEIFIEILIANYFLAGHTPKKLTQSSILNTILGADAQVKIYNFMNNLDFAKKLSYLVSENVLSDKLKQKLWEINKYRLDFSHINSHKEEMKVYSQQEKYKSVLQNLLDINKLMNDELDKINIQRD